MNNAIIGIVGRCGLSQFNKTSIEVFDNFRIATIKSGGNPILILPPQTIEYYNLSPKETPKLTDKEKQILDEQLKLCHGIIMPSGTKRFEYDNYICDYCNKNKIPLLGICMGMQIMCNYDNENINIKIEDNSHYSTDLYKHDVKIDKSSKLYQILNEESIQVNSWHHYCVSNSGSYKIAAKNNDIIEAVEKEGNFNIGFQWHPEKNIDNDINSQKIFKAFIDSAIEYKKTHLN